MKKVLITGANSYIGTSFEKWMQQWLNQYIIDTVDMIDGKWREKDFSMYDIVVHVAGIAHVDIKKATNEIKELYFRVNRDLAIETAVKAKKDGVKQFIFISSIIVYGDSSQFNKCRIIDQDTIPHPSNFYGESKLQAENVINEMQCETFRVAIIRPPIIYGKGSKGNYTILAKYACKFPIFPNVENQRSMLYIDNLCELIHMIIDNEDCGLFFPQNEEYIKTSELVKRIAEVHGNKIILTKLFNPFLYFFSFKIQIINKVFGSLVYDKGMSNYSRKYQVYNLDESIIKTEK
ncbi:NAD-dependent epimerase/dehydratase family protein [Anaerocolumna chitinilytica]|uniref:UDP-glucose 4-epimerase n=1 Tax=Anaerocolumna chitinilytica TaxID=1727145 RepID=A0A7I8DQX3_9FIRM|nr:NAD-dependent epimerase/dehydratase family protein [Anaerocolumna chitinilytica]BCK00824.1 UDP-glucose 4-epimerase [Anaerocolumna chitinilytica]